MHLFIENLNLYEARELIVCRAIHPLYAALRAKHILEKEQEVCPSIFYVQFYEDDEYDTPASIRIVNQRREEQKNRAVAWLNEHCADEDAVQNFVFEYMHNLSDTTVKDMLVDILDMTRGVDYKWIWDDEENTYHYLK